MVTKFYVHTTEEVNMHEGFPLLGAGIVLEGRWKSRGPVLLGKTLSSTVCLFGRGWLCRVGGRKALFSECIS